MALLNSKLLRFVYTETVRESQQRTFPQVKVGALQTLPIHRIDLSNKQDKQVHDDLVKLVDKALEVQKRLAAEKNPIRKEALQSNFELVDNQIEQTVYKLYRATGDCAKPLLRSGSLVNAGADWNWYEVIVKPANILNGGGQIERGLPIRPVEFAAVRAQIVAQDNTERLVDCGNGAAYG